MHDKTLLLFVSAILLISLAGCASRGDLGDDEIPPEIARIPDAVPKVEPLARSGNADSYVVFGKRYHTKKSSRGHVERGVASWYGKPFHGRKTSSGEVYDMYTMSAAHKTLPLPTYARVTNVENGRSVVVRINDRGPFHGERIIDLSYVAGVKLGLKRKGTATVEVRAIEPKRRFWERGPFLADAAVEGAPRTKSTPSATVSRSARQSGGARASTRASAPGPSSRVAARARDESRPNVPSTSGRLTSSATDVPRSPSIYLQVGAFGDSRNAERLRDQLADLHPRDDIRILAPDPADAPLYKVRIGPLQSEQDADRLSRQLAALGVGPPHRVRN